MGELSDRVLIATSVVHDFTFHTLAAMTVGWQLASPIDHMEARFRGTARRVGPIHQLINRTRCFSDRVHS